MSAGVAHRDDPAAQLTERLRSRRPDIEQAILTRAHSVSDPAEVGDPAYTQGLRGAVGAAVGFALEAIERGDHMDVPIPIELLSQARHAARSGVPLDTVMRRYVAGHTLLADFLLQEAQAAGIRNGSLQRPSRSLAALFDALAKAVGEEYRAETEARSRSRRDRRPELVRRLLAGELLEAPELEYDLEAWHLGAIATGPEVEQLLRGMAKKVDCRLLLIAGDERTMWAWFGTRRRPDTRRLLAAGPARPSALALGLGEPGRGLHGWRLTHRQASAALTVSRRTPGVPSAYGEVSLLAAALHDEILAQSLRQAYLAPLANERDGGASLRGTLSAYLAADRNVSSTASALGVSRKTVAARLQVTEERVGRPLGACAAELETALRLAELDESHMV